MHLMWWRFGMFPIRNVNFHSSNQFMQSSKRKAFSPLPLARVTRLARALTWTAQIEKSTNRILSARWHCHFTGRSLFERMFDIFDIWDLKYMIDIFGVFILSPKQLSIVLSSHKSYLRDREGGTGNMKYWRALAISTLACSQAQFSWVRVVSDSDPMSESCAVRARRIFIE